MSLSCPVDAVLVSGLQQEAFELLSRGRKAELGAVVALQVEEGFSLLVVDRDPHTLRSHWGAT